MGAGGAAHGAPRRPLLRQRSSARGSEGRAAPGARRRRAAASPRPLHVIPILNGSQSWEYALGESSEQAERISLSPPKEAWRAVARGPLGLWAVSREPLKMCLCCKSRQQE